MTYTPHSKVGGGAPVEASTNFKWLHNHACPRLKDFSAYFEQQHSEAKKTKQKGQSTKGRKGPMMLLSLRQIGEARSRLEWVKMK
jgi:hypothetical protein